MAGRGDIVVDFVLPCRWGVLQYIPLMLGRRPSLSYWRGTLLYFTMLSVEAIRCGLLITLATSSLTSRRKSPNKYPSETIKDVRRCRGAWPVVGMK